MAERSLRILLAEDRFTELGQTLQCLGEESGKRFELCVVSKRNELADELRMYCPDVALLALTLFQPDPLPSLLLLFNSLPEIPFILLASPADKELAERCLKAGARDYLLEGYMDTRTLKRVLESATRKMETGGTGLLISVKLRNWEEVRRRAGKRKAEEMLTKMAWRLKKSLRATDTATQVSPGHFLLFVQDVNEAGAAAISRRITGHLLPDATRESRGIALQYNVEQRLTHARTLTAGTDSRSLPLLGPPSWPSASFSL